MPTWKNMMAKIGAKKDAGLDVKIPKSAVKMVDRMSRFQRGSRHSFESVEIASDCKKSKDMGKLVS